MSQQIGGAGGVGRLAAGADGNAQSGVEAVVERDRHPAGEVAVSDPSGPDRKPQDLTELSALATLPVLDARELESLRELGVRWAEAIGDRAVWKRALPIDPTLSFAPPPPPVRRFGRFVEVAPERPPLTELEAVEDATETSSPLTQARRLALGAPLRSTAIAQERMRKLVALPVLSADALSSVAYGPQALLAVLVVGGGSALGFSTPIALAIALMMLAVGVSYRQTIRAYPHGGGSYIVASDNLGRLPGLAAAAGLLIDYVLTVAVSIAAGVAAVTSALPSLAPDTVAIGLGVMTLLLAGNLRGIREAGTLFAAPTYAFITAMYLLIVVGLIEAAQRGFHPTPTPPLIATQGLTVFLLLRAFASGSTAMTGIEAISNAVPAFQPTEWRNARVTLTWMVGLLITLFAGTIALVHFDGIIPTPGQTVLSQLAHRTFAFAPLYVFVQATTAAVLFLAANTAFNDFPRVLFLMARDDQAPRLFLRLGDRLAFSNGIIALVVLAAAVYAGFGGNTTALIPLYAVGVFLAFTLSQTGMIVRWWRRRDPHWRKSMLLNATGAAFSGVALVVAAVTKFQAGAWVALLSISVIVVVAELVRRHYTRTREALALDSTGIDAIDEDLRPQALGPAARITPASVAVEHEERPEQMQQLTLLPIGSFDRATMRALAYASGIGHPLLAVHIAPSEQERARFQRYWQVWGDHLPLEIVVSPYRAIVAPLVSYVIALREQRPELMLTIVMPEIIVAHWWQRPLHNQLAARLRRAVRRLPRTIVVMVPYHLAGVAGMNTPSENPARPVPRTVGG
jgi:amino acid transporter